MGRGSALLLGFRVPENFKFPYLASNISDFWRRWHITLSSWLRDYIYIPLGGNRQWRYRNLLITMVLGGLWHGANWTFVIWGLFHGLGLVVYWVWKGQARSFSHNPWWKIFSWAVTFWFVCLGWVFFRSESLEQAGLMFKALLLRDNGPANVFFAYERLFILAVLLGGGLVELALKNKEWLLERLPEGSGEMLRVFRPVAYSLVLLLVLLLNPSNSGLQFIYFQF
jgi:alginate O-acetyltransferase complex protein AlgI